MSPSEKIRAILDERGIDYQMHDGGNRVCFYFDYSEQCGDFLKSIDVIGACVIASQSYLTPEQAIAATAGVGTCHIETTESWLPAERYHRCKHCGAFFAVLDASHDIPPRVCPNCGRRIIEEVTE